MHKHLNIRRKGGICMLQKIKKRDDGFTIIEVLIVLAIAGLIMLIVFLAVPALQRSSRNTQRKNDVSNTLSAINTYTNNNGGTLPGSQANLNTALQEAKLGYYTAANVYYATTPVATVSTSSTATSATVLTTEDVIVIPGYTCSNGQTGVPTQGATRSIALQYAVEVGGGNTGTMQCQSS